MFSLLFAFHMNCVHSKINYPLCTELTSGEGAWVVITRHGPLWKEEHLTEFELMELQGAMLWNSNPGHGGCQHQEVSRALKQY